MCVCVCVWEYIVSHSIYDNMGTTKRSSVVAKKILKVVVVVVIDTRVVSKSI